MGIKADDNLVAALCLNCHYKIDFGKDWTREEKQRFWVAAHRKTVEKLQSMKQWPIDVPVPDLSQWDKIY